MSVSHPPLQVEEAGVQPAGSAGLPPRSAEQGVEEPPASRSDAPVISRSPEPRPQTDNEAPPAASPSGMEAEDADATDAGSSDADEGEGDAQHGGVSMGHSDSQASEGSARGEEHARGGLSRAPRRRPPMRLPAVVVQGPGVPRPGKRQRRTPSTANDSSSDSDDGGGTRGDTENADSDMSDDPEAPLERAMSREQAEADERSVRDMPELVQVLEFLFLYRAALKLRTPISFHALVDALVRSPGPGILASLHLELLKGMGSASPSLSERTWAHFLANRLRIAWLGVTRRSDLGPPPFQAERHAEAAAYAVLPATQRVHALKALCDARLEREDLRTATEEGVVAAGGRPAAATTAAANGAPLASGSSNPGSRAGSVDPGGQPRLTADVLRRQPLGVDGSGSVYWWFDWCDGLVDGGVDYGQVLARELPAPAGARGAGPNGSSRGSSKASKAQGAGQAPGPWEVVAASLEELEAFGARLGRSLRPGDKALAATITGVLVPDIKARAEELDRARKAKERARRTLGLDEADTLASAAATRASRRRAAPVSYRDDEFDRVMDDAIRRVGGGVEPAQPLPRRRASTRSAPDTAAAAALQAEDARRGRSRAGSEPLLALDMFAPRRSRPYRPSRATPTWQENGVGDCSEGEDAQERETGQAALQAQQPPAGDEP